MVVLLVLFTIAGGVAGYLVGVSGPSSTTVSSQPREEFILAASCIPAGNTGTVIATNTGAIPANLTEMIVRFTNGSQTTTAFPHGRVVQPGKSSTLSQGIAYPGSNVNISAVSELGLVFTTTCPITG